jgi:hypothetical protein
MSADIKRWRFEMKKSLISMLLIGLFAFGMFLSCDNGTSPGGGGGGGITYTVTLDGDANTTTTKINFEFSENVNYLNVSNIKFGDGISLNGYDPNPNPPIDPKHWSFNVGISKSGNTTVQILQDGIESGTKTITPFYKAPVHSGTCEEVLEFTFDFTSQTYHSDPVTLSYPGVEHPEAIFKITLHSGFDGFYGNTILPLEVTPTIEFNKDTFGILFIVQDDQKSIKIYYEKPRWNLDGLVYTVKVPIKYDWSNW